MHPSSSKPDTLQSADNSSFWDNPSCLLSSLTLFSGLFFAMVVSSLSMTSQLVEALPYCCIKSTLSQSYTSSSFDIKASLLLLAVSPHLYCYHSHVLPIFVIVLTLMPTYNAIFLVVSPFGIDGNTIFFLPLWHQGKRADKLLLTSSLSPPN